ncbi:MAG: DUF4231 domain-containing protein [Cyanobacteria bacterium]|nr:DUF4231 domain-containing protein [Cyanobacteriota bacterium]MDA0867538.1 DUF4231 domain-containing protein [Cyanobacteriota bacterium]
MSKPKASYNDTLREELSGLVNKLELPELYKQSMKSRWLDQVLWTEGKASRAQKRFYSLRLTTVIGGVIIPALVAFNNFGLEDTTLNKRFSDAFPMALFGLTQLVAVCTAVEEFFQYGVQWRQYRATAENLKSEGWQYFQLSGSYRKAKSHLQAYPVFSTRVERVLRRDVQTYLSEVAKEQNRDDDDDPDETVRQNSVIAPINSGFFADSPEEAAVTTQPLALDDPSGPLAAVPPAPRTRRPPAPPPNRSQRPSNYGPPDAPYEPPTSL